LYFGRAGYGGTGKVEPEAYPCRLESKRRSFFTKQQIEQINKTYDYLHQLHGDAYRQLRKMGRSTSTDKRADGFLASAAKQITGALKFLVAISSSAQEQLSRVVFEVSPLCSDCYSDGTALPAETEDTPGPWVPPPDPANLAKLDHLLEFANRTGRRLACRYKNSPGVIFRGHKKLMDAVIKEHRHFREGSNTPPPTIEFRVNGPDCSRCHRPLKIIDPVKS
jgi:hypothetical protein